LDAGGLRVAASIEKFARTVDKPVVLTEFGYTTRKDPAYRPWEWPDEMEDVVVDQRAQAAAYRALPSPLVHARSRAGLLVWRFYSDPDDVSEEAEFGFSPRGKLAELVLRDAFTTRWASDGDYEPGDFAGRHRARTPGMLGWEMSPDP